MDGQRFDRLTRALASGGSRRDALKALLGLTGAAAAAIVAARTAGARTTDSRIRIPTPAPPVSCATGAPPCSGACCLEGQPCCNGACCEGSCTNGACCPSGSVECAGGCCETGAVCCGTICCQDAGHCSPRGTHCCSPATEVCGEDCCGPDQTCCDGECCDGFCYGEELCCPTGRIFCEATGVCCEAGQQCCGAAGCCWGDCVGGGQLCCPDANGEVCADACCDLATQGCCLGTDSSLTCINKGECCPGAGGCCVNNGVGDVCGEFCCDTTTEECCTGTDGSQSCIALGECCPGPGECCVNNSVGEVCGELCCDIATQVCCTGIDNSRSCIDLGSCCPGSGGCCLDSDCAGEGVCGGSCNLNAHACEYPGQEVQCGAPDCSPELEAALYLVCDGAGSCVMLSEACSPFRCIAGQCPESCSDGFQCLSDVCSDDNTCCSVEESCIGEYCCPAIPDQPGHGCCPGSGCCECFLDRSQQPFCCEGQFEICPSADGDWTRDICLNTTRYYCVANRQVIREYVCDNDVVCATPCCGGTDLNKGPGGACCASGTECHAGECITTGGPCQTLSDGTVVGCVAGEACTTESECTADEGCATIGVCCPGHRAAVNPFYQAPWGDVILCCDAAEESGEGCGGFQPYCRAVPDVHCTSRYSFSR
ncbi:hypothetical protein BH24CHL4_BH24CHL4_04460 [soil metagenome]